MTLMGAGGGGGVVTLAGGRWLTFGAGHLHPPIQ